MKKLTGYLLALGCVFALGCMKEVSFETSTTPSDGSLQSDATGDCLPKTVNGTFTQGTALVATTNTISVQVNVLTAGSYLAYTDTVNGFFFRASGTFTATGTNTITLRGNGTPFAAGTHNFVVTYDSTICDVQVTTVVSGGGGPATFTLQGAPASCMNAVVNGTYTAGTALGAGNTVTIGVNVTAIGTYTIATTTNNGMTFSATGTFSTTGVQNVTLAGTGTPVTGTNTTIPVTAGASTCSFVVNVSAPAPPAAGTLGGAPGTCTPITVNGSFMVGNPVNASNTAVVQVNVTTAGSYTITSNTVSGMTYSASGNFAATGPATVTLNGTGAPTVSGPVVLTVTFGASSCTFTITVKDIDYYPRTVNSNWSYETDNVATDSLLRKVISPTHTAFGNTYAIFMGTDDAALGFDSSGYFRKNNTDYFEWFDAGAFIGYDNEVWSEYTILQAGTATGTPWYSPDFVGTFMSNTYHFRFKYTILQKDVTVNITTSTGTVNYPNTIVVEEKYEQMVGGNWVDVTSTVGYGKSYYARGVGLIKYENFNGAGALQGQVELRRYVIF